MMKKILWFLVFVAISMPLSAVEPALSDASGRYAYAMGIRLGQLLKAQGVEQLDSDAFAAAIDDVLRDRPLRLTTEEMMTAIQEQQRLLVAQKQQRARQNLEKGRSFLAQNAERPGITVLPGGVQYRVLESGSGARATPASRVRVHYHGTLLDGTVFDSSVERGQPAEFSLSAVIPGFRDSIAEMRAGDRWQVFIPSDQAYGEDGAGGDIGPNETLTFEIQLIEVLQ